MRLDRKNLYRFPWSMTDNPSGWVEVTDCCNLSCPGCYKLRIEGHRPLEGVLEDIKAYRAITNCDSMKISGGEPLIYPHIVEVVEFIARNGMKPLILTNGLELDRPLAIELMKAGLSRFNFHIDSGQNRQGWEASNERELNELRRNYTDLVWELNGVQCGFNATISRTNLEYIPETHKYLVSVIIGSSDQLHGVIGAKAVELVQVLSHLINMIDLLVDAQDR